MAFEYSKPQDRFSASGQEINAATQIVSSAPLVIHMKTRMIRFKRASRLIVPEFL